MLRLLYPALTAVALHAALLGVFVARNGGDISALLCVSPANAGEFPYENVHSSFQPSGYDGQFYYAIARAPLHHHVAGIDNPPVRQLRIAYPLLSWALSGGGEPYWLHFAMPLVNLLAIGGLAWLGAVFAQRQGLNAWWGVLLPFAVNAGLPALRDLTDTVAIAAVAALLVAWVLRWPWWSVLLCGALALFSREQNLPVVAIVIGCAFWQRRWTSGAALILVVIGWTGWVAYLWQLYQAKPFVPATGHYDRPFQGLLYALTHVGYGVQETLNQIVCLLLLGFQALLACILLRRRQGDPVFLLTTLFALALVVVGWPSLFIEVWGFARIYMMLPLAVWLACVQTRWLWPLPWLSAYVLVQWSLVFTAGY